MVVDERKWKTESLERCEFRSERTWIEVGSIFRSRSLTVGRSL